ncbi:MAG TPA: SGNH/GDSL hydrolase family protein [Thermoanaerobaculia bacterium]|jgi:lysophospholipase L1-like esterase
MNKTSLRSVILGASLAILASAPLSAQFHKYVALGDSLTAAVEGTCVVERNQNNSYPKVIAGQLGITDFEQPLVQELPLTDPLVGIPCKGAIFIPPSTVTVGNISQMGAPLNSLLPRPYDNLGMPGADTADLVDLTTGNLNGTTAEKSAALVLRNVPGSPFAGLNAVTEANLLSPDLVSLWIGNNDLLGAALSGVALDGVTLTPVPVFTAKYEEIVNDFVDVDYPVVSRLIAANIPDVTAIPLTTTIPAVLVDPSTRRPVTIGGELVPLLGEGDDQFPCTPVAPDQGCPLPPGTLVTLPASAWLAQGVGVPVAAGGTGLPLPNGRFVPPATLEAGVTLYPAEVSAIRDRIDTLNQVIGDTIAAHPRAVLVDIHGIYNDIKANGYLIGGITLTADFLTGGIFSADGFHPSSIGYTIVADEFIKTLNVAGNMDIERPDFSEILFAPNVPVTGESARDGGIWGYSLEMWRSLLATAAPAHGLRIELPVLQGEPRGGGRRTRVVSRD